MAFYSGHVTPGANGYRLPNGQWVAPTEDFGYGQNPYDPETEPALYNKWAFEHQGDAQQIGQDYNARRVNSIIGGTVASGAFGAGGPLGVAAPSAAAPGALTVPTVTGSLAGVTLPGSTALPALTATGTAAALPAAAAPAATAGPSAAAPAATAGEWQGPVQAVNTAKTGSSFLSQLGRYLPIAATAVKTYLNNRASNTAQGELTAANQQALTDARNIYGGVSKTLGGLYSSNAENLGKIYQGQYANLAPYASLGSGAAGLLGQGLGVPVSLPPTQAPSLTPFTPPETAPGLAPSIQPGGTPLAPLTPGAGRIIPPNAPPGGGAVPRGTSGGVQMRSPDGEIGMVPAERVNEARAKGAVVIG